MSKRPTEADFESEITRVLYEAFPMLATRSLSHQTSFQVRLGHSTQVVGGGRKAWLRGRSDILIACDGKPLAMLELKREGLPLTDDDRLQGLSYARLTEPWPPLVVVSNGTETKIYKTFDGELWTPVEPDEKAIVAAFESSATLAQADIKKAVDVLLGPGSRVWMELVREFSASQILGLTGNWNELLKPFPIDLIFPRKATAILNHCVSETDRIPLIVGPPLSGKSNVLREFENANRSSPNYGVLYLDADSSGQGIFRTLANLMSRKLGWQFDVDQVRGWLRRLSSSKDSPSLVLVVDGGSVADLKPELDELVSGDYGPRLRLVVALDEGAAQSLTLSGTKRQVTALGSRSVHIELKPLDDEEFEATSEVLREKRITFFLGGQHATEFRIPWLLRSIVAMISTDKKYCNESILAVLPSIPGLRPLAFADERFNGNEVLHGQFLRLAEAILIDIDDKTRSPELRMLTLSAFACREATLRKVLDHAEIESLVLGGYLKHRVLGTDRLLVSQTPTYSASCVGSLSARLFQQELVDGTDNAVESLVRRCAQLPYGEVIGAKALLEVALKSHGITSDIVEHLMARPPKRVDITPGTRMMMQLGEDKFQVEHAEGGRMFLIRSDGSREEIERDENDAPPRTHSDITPWLILSHFASVPIIGFPDGDFDHRFRVDGWILLEIGQCKIVLKRPEADRPDRVSVHEIGEDVAIVCHEEGIVEPVTFAIMQLISGADEIAEQFVAEAKRTKSLPMLCRINIALLYCENDVDSKKAAWASRIREEEILPEVEGTLFDH